MFYSFASLYAWLHKCGILISVFCIQSVAICCLVKENPASTVMCLDKGGIISIAFLDNHGYSFLALHQNLTSGSFLKCSCNVKSEIN